VHIKARYSVLDSSPASGACTARLPPVAVSKGQFYSFWVKAHAQTITITDASDDTSDDADFTNKVIGDDECQAFYCDGEHWYEEASNGLGNPAGAYAGPARDCADVANLTSEERAFLEDNARAPACWRLEPAAGNSNAVLITVDTRWVIVDASSASAAWTVTLPNVDEAKGKDYCVFIEAASGSYTGTIQDAGDDTDLDDVAVGTTHTWYSVAYYSDGVHWYRLSRYQLSA
jgi:hypothetical protein